MNMVWRLSVFGGLVGVLPVLAASTAFAVGPPSGPLTKCPPDAVIVGTACMDKYEASVWSVPNPTTTNKALVTKIQNGKATLANLQAGGATQNGAGAEVLDYPCAANGQDCGNKIYAVSIAGVLPSGLITWFQAQEACTNSRKRLPSNAEWQAAANGTPDPGPDNGTTDCNTSSVLAAVNTGSRSACVSARGAYDMVGNLEEWVADWVPLSSTCPGWGTFSNDIQCYAGAATYPNVGPGALRRGGDFGFGTGDGPLYVRADAPVTALGALGFRCAR
jgi:hypothetical protein